MGTDAPRLRVVRGQPTDEELAALLAVLAARPPAESTVDAGGAARSAWADPGRRLRAMPRPGPGAWRRSGLPG